MFALALGFLASPVADRSQPTGDGSDRHHYHSKEAVHPAMHDSKEAVRPKAHDSETALRPAVKLDRHISKDVDSTLDAISKANILPTHHTCTSKLPVTQACPSVAENADRSWNLEIPADARWLFYGPSFLGQAYATIVAANAHQIEKVEGLDSEDLLQAMPPKLQAGSSCKYLPEHTCNILSENATCDHNLVLGVQRITFENGAVVVGIIDHRELQTEHSGHWLSVFLKQLKLDHAFYMQPHVMNNWAGLFLCAKEVDLRQEAELQLTRQNDDMCTKAGKKGLTMAHHRKCVEKSELWQAVNDTLRTVTLVPPWSVPPDEEENDLDTMSVVERYNCSAEPSTNHNEKQYGRLYFGKELRWENKSHVRQCTVLQDGNGDLFPGAIMEVAEQLVEKGSKATVEAQEDMDWQAEKAKEIPSPSPPSSPSPPPAPFEEGSGSGSGSGGWERLEEVGSGSGSGSGDSEFAFAEEPNSNEFEADDYYADDTTASKRAAIGSAPAEAAAPAESVPNVLSPLQPLPESAAAPTEAGEPASSAYSAAVPSVSAPNALAPNALAPAP